MPGVRGDMDLLQAGIHDIEWELEELYGKRERLSNRIRQLELKLDGLEILVEDVEAQRGWNRRHSSVEDRFDSQFTYGCGEGGMLEEDML